MENFKGSVNKQFGNSGENEAIFFLKKNGYEIIQKNFICDVGEIDIIALKDKIVHFVEVKSRHSRNYGMPYEAVSFAKKRKMIRAAQFYVMKNKKWDSFGKSFTVIGIDYSSSKPVIDFFPDAFSLNDGGYS